MSKRETGVGLVNLYMTGPIDEVIELLEPYIFSNRDALALDRAQVSELAHRPDSRDLSPIQMLPRKVMEM